MAGRTSEQLRNEARRLLASGFVEDPLVARSGAVGAPIPVRSLEEQAAGWFVPVVVDDRLAGFFQFDGQGSLLRFSSFQRQVGSIDGAPAASSWLDPEVIAKRALGVAGSSRQAGDPFLTYDGNVTRLAWAVPMRTEFGDAMIVLVAGEYAYRAP